MRPTRMIATFALVASIALQLSAIPTSVLAQDDLAPNANSPPAAFPWPHQFSSHGSTFTIYPPELEHWAADRLTARAAIAVERADAPKAVFGVAMISAHTGSAAADAAVTVNQLSVEQVSFPTETAERAAQDLDAIRRNLADFSWTISRERLQAQLAIAQSSRTVQVQPLRNQPPRIVFADAPSVLVTIDGAPQLREMVGFGLARVINTRALMFRDDRTQQYFLFVADRWLEAQRIDGPWTEAQVRPGALDIAKEEVAKQGSVDLLENGDRSDDRVPAIVVSTEPAELLQTQGAPQYAPISGTRLLYVTNSPNRIFLDLSSQRYLVLLAGRWFSATNLTASDWRYVDNAALPEDFAKIPDDHVTAAVREAVAGTPVAQEAAIANSVPQIATVKRAQAELSVAYDGTPHFEPIESTSLQYAVNASVPVIRVEENAFYALDNGVWFAASSPFGAWTVATSVPSVVYTIPRSSPLHYVTYVRVYDATPDTVEDGYTPGYAGSYTTPGNTVVYGTGWDYRPWVGSVWYGAPTTWGSGFSTYDTWWGGWPWSPWWGPGWAGGSPFFEPWWGPWAVAGPSFFFARNHFHGHRHDGVHHDFHHAHGANVTHVFNRWGQSVATPFHPNFERRNAAGFSSNAPAQITSSPLLMHNASPRPSIATPLASQPSIGNQSATSHAQSMVQPRPVLSSPAAPSASFGSTVQSIPRTQNTLPAPAPRATVLVPGRAGGASHMFEGRGTGAILSGRGGPGMWSHGGVAGGHSVGGGHSSGGGHGFGGGGGSHR